MRHLILNSSILVVIFHIIAAKNDSCEQTSDTMCVALGGENGCADLLGHAHCVSPWCKCLPGTCHVDGQCVKTTTSTTTTTTTTTTSTTHCARSTNKSCLMGEISCNWEYSNRAHCSDRVCMCKPGYCPSHFILGIARRCTKASAEISMTTTTTSAACARSTNKSCIFGDVSCNSAYGNLARCVNQMCMCKAGYCASDSILGIATRCTTQTTTTTTQRCKRHLGSSCLNALGSHGCGFQGRSSCIHGRCVCNHGFCARENSMGLSVCSICESFTGHTCELGCPFVTGGHVSCRGGRCMCDAGYCAKRTELSNEQGEVGYASCELLANDHGKLDLSSNATSESTDILRKDMLGGHTILRHRESITQAALAVALIALVITASIKRSCQRGTASYAEPLLLYK